MPHRCSSSFIGTAVLYLPLAFTVQSLGLLCKRWSSSSSSCTVVVHTSVYQVENIVYYVLRYSVLFCTCCPPLPVVALLRGLRSNSTCINSMSWFTSKRYYMQREREEDYDVFSHRCSRGWRRDSDSELLAGCEFVVMVRPPPLSNRDIFIYYSSF